VIVQARPTPMVCAEARPRRAPPTAIARERERIEIRSVEARVPERLYETSEGELNAFGSGKSGGLLYVVGAVNCLVVERRHRFSNSPDCSR
jgi:hypothetical protein